MTLTERGGGVFVGGGVGMDVRDEGSVWRREGLGVCRVGWK